MIENYIKLGDCKRGHVYLLSSRNLSMGAYDGNEGFVGIRTKFSDRYLFTEYHYDQGAPFGTVFPREDLGPLPEGIKPEEGVLSGMKEPIFTQNKALFEYLVELSSKRREHEK